MPCFDASKTFPVISSLIMATKKAYTKEDLKRLMQEKKNASKTKIDSPLAHYDASGQLSCVICTCGIKSEALWSAHLGSKAHKEVSLLSVFRKPSLKDFYFQKLDLLKRRKQAVEAQKKPFQGRIDKLVNESDKKRKATPGDVGDHAFKVPRQVSGDGSLVVQAQSSKESESPSVSSDEEEEVVQVDSSVVTDLPADFFDKPIKAVPRAVAAPVNDGTVEATDKSESELPKGFFDNPKEDARVRNPHVVYKDPLDEEWERFQRVMATESHRAEHLVEEDLEDIQSERTNEEIEQQMSSWEKVGA